MYQINHDNLQAKVMLCGKIVTLDALLPRRWQE